MKKIICIFLFTSIVIQASDPVGVDLTKALQDINKRLTKLEENTRYLERGVKVINRNLLNGLEKADLLNLLMFAGAVVIVVVGIESLRSYLIKNKPGEQKDLIEDEQQIEHS